MKKTTPEFISAEQKRPRSTRDDGAAEPESVNEQIKRMFRSHNASSEAANRKGRRKRRASSKQ